MQSCGLIGYVHGDNIVVVVVEKVGGQVWLTNRRVAQITQIHLAYMVKGPYSSRDLIVNIGIAEMCDFRSGDYLAVERSHVLLYPEVPTIPEEGLSPIKSLYLITQLLPSWNQAIDIQELSDIEF